MKSTDTDGNEGSTIFLGAISEDRNYGEDKWFTDLPINRTTVQFRIDTVQILQ